MESMNLERKKMTSFFSLTSNRALAFPSGMHAGKSLSTGFYNKIPSTEQFKQQVSILPVLEAGRSKLNVPADLGPGENSLPGL